MQWLGEGHRNTKYFHHRTSKRRRKNTIVGLWNDGVWCDSKEGIIRTITGYFEDIYTFTHPSRLEEVTNLIQAKVSKEMNDELTKDFTTKEVKIALRQMHPTKVPGPDGMSAIFYQKYWDIVLSDVY